VLNKMTSAVPFQLTKKNFVEFSASSFYSSFGNVKIILNHKQNMLQRPRCCHHVIKELVHAFSCAYIELCTWNVWTQLKKLELLSAIALRNSHPSFMLSKLSACIDNSIFFSARERAELNKSCKLFGS